MRLYSFRYFNIVKLQAKSLDQELTLFYPCHKNNNKNNKKNKNPSPKSIRRVCARRLKFDTKTNHKLLAEFRGLGVQMIHVTRRTRTTRRTPPKSTISEHPKNLFVTHRCLPKKFCTHIFCGPKFFFNQKCLFDQKKFWDQKFF